MSNNSKELSKMEIATLTIIGRNVRFVRRKLLGATLVDMSKHTNVSRDVICRLEMLASGDGCMGDGRVYPSISTVIKFSESIGVTPGELIDIDFEKDDSIQKRILDHCKEIIDFTRGITQISSEIVE